MSFPRPEESAESTLTPVPFLAEKPVPDWSKSAVYVARYHIQHGGGDQLLARQYLEYVASSNAEEVTQATELLRRLLPARVPIQQANVSAVRGTSAEGPSTGGGFS